RSGSPATASPRCDCRRTSISPRCSTGSTSASRSTPSSSAHGFSGASSRTADRSARADGQPLGPGHPDDLAAQPRLLRTTEVDHDPIQLPVAVLGVVGQLLADGGAGRSPGEADGAELVLG